MNFKEARDRGVELTLKKREIQSTLDDVQKELSSGVIVISSDHISPLTEVAFPERCRYRRPSSGTASITLP